MLTDLNSLHGTRCKRQREKQTIHNQFQLCLLRCNAKLLPLIGGCYGLCDRLALRGENRNEKNKERVGVINIGAGLDRP